MTDPRQLNLLLSLFSPAWPTGAFAYSHGLETAIALGEVADAEGLRAWLADVVKLGAGRTDAILLAAAWRGNATEAAELANALASSAERQRETLEQGAAFARSAAQVHGTDPTPQPLPVAIGSVARALDLPLRPVLIGALHGFVSNLVSCAIRAVPLGQAEGQAVLAALFPTIEDVAEEAEVADLDAIGTAVFGADLAAMAHEVQRVRIYRT